MTRGGFKVPLLEQGYSSGVLPLWGGDGSPVQAGDKSLVVSAYKGWKQKAGRRAG
ncbi:MAG: hypothetical protein GX754_11250 [Clostridiaceae bacterium]|nr:hypothetical protein [Clostridiaceae bacterium]